MKLSNCKKKVFTCTTFNKIRSGSVAPFYKLNDLKEALQLRIVLQNITINLENHILNLTSDGWEDPCKLHRFGACRDFLVPLKHPRRFTPYDRLQLGDLDLYHIKRLLIQYKWTQASFINGFYQFKTVNAPTIIHTFLKEIF